MIDNAEALFESAIPDYPLIGRGKVRDIYSIDNEHLLLVASDRLSAFDVVLPDPVPGKGEVLTQISLFWFRMMADIIDNQLTTRTIDDVIADPELCEQLRRRSLVVRRLKPLPIEAVVRGYLIGSGWKDYRDSGRVCGIELPAGLQQADRLPTTLFTPATRRRPATTTRTFRLTRSSTWSANITQPAYETLQSKSTSARRHTHCSGASSSRTPNSSSVWMKKAVCI
jgi:phosphoribosylaminoimidazole-succinocarboxamide synthase